MRYLILLSAILCAQNLWALPVVGEKVVYSGDIMKFDGMYQIEQSFEVMAFDPVLKIYNVKVSISQYGEGGFLGARDIDIKVPEAQYKTIEQGIIPFLESQCGTVVNPESAATATKTSKDVLVIDKVAKNVCKVEAPVIQNSRTITWFSKEYSPFAVQIMEVDAAENTATLLKLKSYYKPAPVEAPAPAPIPEETKPQIPIFEDPNAPAKP